MTSIVLYSAAFASIILSLIKSREKTQKGIKIAVNSFLKLLPSMLSIMLFIGITLAFLDKNMISKIIGSNSGVFGIMLSLIVGSITLVPSFVAFPLGKSLLNSGAGYSQIAALVSTIMAVGIITIPLEIKHFDKKVVIKRNVAAFIICVIFTMVIGVIKR